LSFDHRFGALLSGLPPMIDPHDFISWWDRWKDLWTGYKGVYLPDCDARIAEILEMWQAPVPGLWKRNDDRPRLRVSRYSRGDKGTPNPGEDRIEHEILCECFDNATVLGGKLIEGLMPSRGSKKDVVEHKPICCC
jgi:hypothetical protein